MKHLQKFATFEAVIIPTKIEDNSVVNSFESAVEFGIKHNFDVVGYDEFIQNQK